MFSKIIIYARFSSAGQSEGTSLERQFGDIEAWIAREGLADLPTLHVTDEGRSGYHGHHRSLGDFGRLEKEIAAGEHVGSLFVCEDLDRLSRQGFDIGNDMIRSFISHGVSVRSLKGDVYDAGTKTALDQNIRALVRLEMAHEESAKKAERTAANWRLRREKCRTEGTLVSKNCPPWIEADAQNKPRAIRDRAELVRRFFEMADQGLGADAISRTMAAEGIEPWTRYKGREAAVWTRGTIIRILQNRETIGEYQPRKDGRPDGEPWIGHYPAIVSHDLFERVSAAASARKKMAGGRRSPRIGNLFATSIKCACCGQSMTYQIGRSEGSTFDNRGKSYSYKRDCASLVCRTAQISKGTKCKNVAHWAYLTLEDTLVSILLPLAFDDSAFSNRGEVARISQLIAEAHAGIGAGKIGQTLERLRRYDKRRRDECRPCCR